MIKERLESITEEEARNANLVLSSAAGLTYFWLLFSISNMAATSVLASILVAAAFDWSTVYFVHSGVLSGTLGRVMSEKDAGRFMKLHLWPGMFGYLLLAGFAVSLFVERTVLLYYGFLAGWVLMYVSGLYPYLKLKDHQD